MSSWANFFLFLWCEKLWGWRALVAPQIGGGVPFVCPTYSEAACLHPLPGVLCLHPLRLPNFSPFGQTSSTLQPIPCISSGQNIPKRVKSKWIFGVLWYFLGNFGDNKRQNLRYIWVLRLRGLPLWLSLWGGGGVHWVQVVRSCSLSLGVFRPFLPAFALFPAFLSCFAFQICLI